MSDKAKFEFEYKSIETVDGEEIQLPKVSWKQEKIIFSVVGQMIETLAGTKLVDIDFRKLDVADIPTMIPIFLEHTPDHITRVVSIILSKDMAWVDKNLGFEAVIQTVSPFFFRLWKMLEVYMNQTNKKTHQKLMQVATQQMTQPP